MIVTSILTVFLPIFQCENVFTTKIELDRFEILNSTYVDGFFNISEILIKRINRTTYVLNFESTTFKDIDNRMEFEVSFHRNRLNNNQYNKMPFGLSKRSACLTLQQHYNIIHQELKDISNFAQLKEGDDICPIKKVNISYVT